jgi:demethylmenaquinone methyltransferase/2-methoxy-6-polyprenyl-1,4-benzoquinol methylase
MCKHGQPSNIAFFDSLALKWDDFHDLKALALQIDAGLECFGIKSDEHILDVGCGTGNLTAALLRRLSSDGKITAVDLSVVMIEKAKSKINDSRVNWICSQIDKFNVVPESFDRIICYSVWPHLENKDESLLLFKKWLKPGGMLHIWHTISREMVNKIHSEASAAVQNHLLAPVSETVQLLEQSGFSVKAKQDDLNGYLVTAHKA